MAKRLGIRHAVKHKAFLWLGFAFFLCFFFLPLINYYVRGFSPGVGTGFGDAFIEILRNPSTYRIIAFTSGQAALSALISVILSLPGAYALSHFRFPGRRLLSSATLVPFVMPSIVVIICIISFYGKSGLINQIFRSDLNLVYNFFGILIAHVFYNFALSLRIVAGGWQKIDGKYVEAASSLGEGRIRSFIRITIPLLMPSIVTAFMLIFIYCFFSFGIVLVFGGIKFSTLEVKIFQEMYMKLDFLRAAVFSLIQLLFSVFFIIIANRFLEKSQVSMTSTGEIHRFSTLRFSNKVLFLIYGLFICFFLIGPVITMVIRSFTVDGRLSFFNFNALFNPELSGRNIEGIIRSSIPAVIVRSIVLAVSSGTLVFLAALGISLNLKGEKSTATVSFFQIPIGISLVSLCIGMNYFFEDRLPSILLVVTAQFFLAFPFVFRMVRTCVEDLDPRLVESAVGLGAGHFHIFRTVYFPVLGKGLANGYVFAVAICFADFTAVLTIGKGAVATFPVAIYRLLGFRSFDLAFSLSVLYIAICLLFFLAIDVSSGRAEYG